MEAATGDRWDLIARLVGAADSILDVGCRNKALQRHVPEATRYVGLDLGPPADVIASAEDALPFADDTFHTIVFADVLEHLNDPHRAFREGLRVATSGVVVLLPNLFHYRTRLAMLRGTLGTDKYDLGPGPRVDRHRWFIHFDHARAFVSGVAYREGWTVDQEFAYDGGPHHVVSRAATAVLRGVAPVPLWAFAYAAHVTPSVPRAAR